MASTESFVTVEALPQTITITSILKIEMSDCLLNCMNNIKCKISFLWGYWRKTQLYPRKFHSFRGTVAENARSI